MCYALRDQAREVAETEMYAAREALHAHEIATAKEARDAAAARAEAEHTLHEAAAVAHAELRKAEGELGRAREQLLAREEECVPCPSVPTAAAAMAAVGCAHGGASGEDMCANCLRRCLDIAEGCLFHPPPAAQAVTRQTTTLATEPEPEREPCEDDVRWMTV